MTPLVGHPRPTSALMKLRLWLLRGRCPCSTPAQQEYCGVMMPVGPMTWRDQSSVPLSVLQRHRGPTRTDSVS